MQDEPFWVHQHLELRIKQFELVYRGSLRDVKDQSQVILAREKEPTQLPDGQWMKVYVMGDGSSHYMSASTKDGFAAREMQLWPTKSQP